MRIQNWEFNEFNGTDTVILNWSTIGDPGRNPGYTIKQATSDMQRHFGVSKVIFIEGIPEGDRTRGHIDGIARFINRHTVVIPKCTGRSLCQPGDGRDSLIFDNAARVIVEAGFNVVRDPIEGAIMDAQIDLNPHQVDAALFTFRNPLNKGVLLADEVGLGKTIEAGIVIAQKWAERKRRILIIVPANLRKQWHQELQEKFGIDGQLLESASYNKAKKAGVKNPFNIGDGLVICSYQFASSKADDSKNNSLGFGSN